MNCNGAARALRIPNTKLELGLGYRQVEAADLSRFQEPDGASEEDLQHLRVKAIFAVAGKITSDVGLRCGEQSFPAGEYDFGSTRNMTFALPGAENLIVLDGAIRVDSVTDAMVTGGLDGSYDDDNDVSGTFELTVCP